MRVIVGKGHRGPLLSGVVVLAAVFLLATTVFTGFHIVDVAVISAVVIGVVVAHRRALRWEALVAAILVVVLFIPIRRYALPGGLPFELEPYRLLVALVLVGWLTSLLIDPRVRVRASGFEGPLFLFLFTALLSVIVNDARVHDLRVEPEVVKKLMFLASFLLVFYLIVSTTRTFAQVNRLVAVLVTGGAVLGALSIIESRTGYNPFNHFSGIIPLLEPQNVTDPLSRGSRFRAYGSAQHPIALAAALVMLVPLAIHLAYTSGRRRWWAAAALLSLGAVATVSRTSLLMLAAVFVAFVWLRPRETKRFVPAVVPLLLALQFALPGAFSSLRQALLPPGGLIAQQSQNAGWRGSGRFADVGPALREYSTRPLVGQGYGTRVTEAGRENALILDNQWLGTLLETGLVGAFAWAWLFTRFIRSAGREAKRDEGPRGWLLTALTASVAAFAAGMLTHDSFAFIQEEFLLFAFLAFGAALLPASQARVAEYRVVSHSQ